MLHRSWLHSLRSHTRIYSQLLCTHTCTGKYRVSVNWPHFCPCLAPPTRLGQLLCPSKLTRSCTQTLSIQVLPRQSTMPFAPPSRSSSSRGGSSQSRGAYGSSSSSVRGAARRGANPTGLGAQFSAFKQAGGPEAFKPGQGGAAAGQSEALNRFAKASEEESSTPKPATNIPLKMLASMHPARLAALGHTPESVKAAIAAAAAAAAAGGETSVVSTTTTTTVQNPAPPAAAPAATSAFAPAIAAAQPSRPIAPLPSTTATKPAASVTTTSTTTKTNASALAALEALATRAQSTSAASKSALGKSTPAAPAMRSWKPKPVEKPDEPFGTARPSSSSVSSTPTAPQSLLSRINMDTTTTITTSPTASQSTPMSASTSASGRDLPPHLKHVPVARATPSPPPSASLVPASQRPPVSFSFTSVSKAAPVSSAPPPQSKWASPAEVTTSQPTPAPVPVPAAVPKKSRWDVPPEVPSASPVTLTINGRANANAATAPSSNGTGVNGSGSRSAEPAVVAQPVAQPSSSAVSNGGGKVLSTNGQTKVSGPLGAD